MGMHLVIFSESQHLRISLFPHLLDALPQEAMEKMREMVLEDPSLDTMDADADRKCVEFVQQMVRSRQTEAAEKVLVAYYQKKVARVGEGAPGLLPLMEAHVLLYKHKEDWASMAAWAERALNMLRRLAGEGTVTPRQPRPLRRTGTPREMVEEGDPSPRRAGAKRPPAPHRCKATPPRAQKEVALGLSNFALAIAPAGRTAEAERCFQEALAIQEDVRPPPSPLVLSGHAASLTSY